MSISIRFSSPASAYAALAEFRRVAGDLAWDLSVRQDGAAALLLVPAAKWSADEWLRAIAARYGGLVS
jgi:hypothetical protein